MQQTADGISITDKTGAVWNDYRTEDYDSVQRFGDIDRSSAFGAEGQMDSEMDNDEDY